MAIRTLKQMPYQWLYNPIIEITAIGNIIETLGNIIKMLKISPTITVSVCYYISQLSSGLQVWADFQCRKCNIINIISYNTGTCALSDIYALTLRRCVPLGVVHTYQALVHCPIYTHSPSGVACPWVLCIHIRQSTLACVVTYT